MHYSDAEAKEVFDLIPSSWFTKTGPGVDQYAREAVRRMSRRQAYIAADRGWIPTAWVDTSRRNTRAHTGAHWVPPECVAPQPGIISRLWNKLKGWFK